MLRWSYNEKYVLASMKKKKVPNFFSEAGVEY